MDAAKQEKYKLPMIWVDRIFSRFDDIFGEKFTRKFSKAEYRDLEKMQWASGLYGLNGDQIKSVLNLCLNNQIKEPPNVIEFYHYAKRWREPAPTPVITSKANPEIQSHYMQQIRTKLNGQGAPSDTSLSDQHK